MRVTFVLGFLVSTAGLASAQTGSFTEFGLGCKGTGGTPAIYSEGSPTIGKDLGIHVKTGMNNGVAIMALGSTKTNYYGMSLPFDLAALGAKGCSIYVGLSVLIPTRLNSVGVGGNTYTIPYSEHLVGLEFHSQYYLDDPTANALGIVASDAATIVIGK